MSKQSEEKYFNFPVQLLEGFMVDCDKCLNNIADYALVKHSQSLEGGSPLKKLSASYEYFDMKGVGMDSLRNGQILIDSLPSNSPISGIPVRIWLEFYRNDKSEFEKANLLAFLAIKSIIGNKAYCKMTNAFLLSRMDGKVKSIGNLKENLNELSHEIRKYSTEYQTKKITSALYAIYKVAFYKKTKGFYASTRLSLEQLVNEVIKIRKSDNYIQAYQKAIKEAEKRAYNDHNTS